MSQLFDRILDGCRRSDPAQIRSGLDLLIERSGRSPRYTREYMNLFRLCLAYLNSGRIDEIRTAFERLSRNWVSAVFAAAARYEVARSLDVEVEEIDDAACMLRTGDAEVARRIVNIRGTRLDTIQGMPRERTVWNIVVQRRRLKGILNRLRKPQYWEFLEKHKSRQLSIEF